MRDPSTPLRTGILSSLFKAASDCTAIVCKFCVDEFLARGICKGSLIFALPDGTCTLFGEPESDARDAGHPTARLTLVNVHSFYTRVAATADIGFAEAYMAGDFTVEKPEELTNIFRVLILNRDNHTLSASSLLLSRLGAKLNTLIHVLRRNTLSQAARNIQAHYDLSNEMFATFLGDTWMYSCAYYDPSKALHSISLDEAQHAKIDRILDKARITAECHVLDIGCGWGELAIRAAQRTGCTVTGITLSHEQLTLGRKRARDAGVEDKVKFELVDYREMAKRGQKYERVISVEMIEAVGHEFLGRYFAAVEDMLKVDGVAVVQMITIPEQRYEEYRQTTDFIQKHVFPGGLCPSFAAVVNAMAKNSDLMVEDVENLGVHYGLTLAEWRKRLLESAARGSVGKAGFDETFVRKFEYYFSYCEAGFATRTLGLLQMVLTRCNNTGTLGEYPQQRV